MSMFWLQKENVYAIPVIHYNMEMAGEVCRAFHHLQPDCVAVELAETMHLQLLHAASRLPDISLVVTQTQTMDPLYYMCEPCDPSFEALRCAMENQKPAFCIDLDVDNYPAMREPIPDPYSIRRIGLKEYYEMYKAIALANEDRVTSFDRDRELYMARKLKELSLRYEKVFFVGGMFHVQRVLDLMDRNYFPTLHHAPRDIIEIATLTEDSARDVMAEYGWVSMHYEISRKAFLEKKETQDVFSPDRQKLLLNLYKEASKRYVEDTGNTFPGYHLRNTMKFARNYALITDRLLPDLFQLLCSAKGCVDHNYAYEVWNLATEYPYRKNVDGLLELNLSIKDVWGHSKLIRFHLKTQNPKAYNFGKKRKDRSKIQFQPPGMFMICSHQPEDAVIERFGEFLKKKGTQIITEEAARSIPFTTSIEDGIDTRETIRHWSERKLFVKSGGKPPGGVGSVVVVFDEDQAEEGKIYEEKYPWKITWLGEHSQESDMAFYATPITAKVIGAGISRCEYGGFLMSYPPRRMFNVWVDPDYAQCRTKAEVLLMASIDYALKPIVVYVGSKPPRSIFKSYASRFGKKIVYIPIGQLSPITLNKLRAFHVLDGHDKRDIAGEYIN